MCHYNIGRALGLFGDRIEVGWGVGNGDRGGIILLVLFGPARPILVQLEMTASADGMMSWAPFPVPREVRASHGSDRVERCGQLAAALEAARRDAETRCRLSPPRRPWSSFAGTAM